MLVDILTLAADACGYAAEDYAERADYERRHGGDEEADFLDAEERYRNTQEFMEKLAAAIAAGEIAGREDHDV